MICELWHIETPRCNVAHVYDEANYVLELD